MYENIQRVKHEPPVTPGERHSYDDDTLYQVAWYSHDRIIGFLGRKNFLNITDMLEYLIEFEPEEKLDKNGYGYFRIYHNSGYAYFDQLPASALAIIEGLISQFKEFRKEIREEDVKRSIDSLSDADFGRITES